MAAKDKIIVLITGANHGIGLTTTAKLATSSAKYHLIMGVRSTERGKAAMEKLQTEHKLLGSLSVQQIDVEDYASIKAAAAAVDKEFGRLDVLINNAGIWPKDDDSLTRYRRAFEVNVFGTAQVTREFTHLLAKSADARLLYITSSMGSVSWNTGNNASTQGQLTIEYSASKSAINFVMHLDHLRMHKDNIKVWAVCPGYVATGLGSEGTDRGENAKLLASYGAGSAVESAETIEAVVEGKRDADVGKIVHKTGVYNW